MKAGSASVAKSQRLGAEAFRIANVDSRWRELPGRTDVGATAGFPLSMSTLRAWQPVDLSALRNEDISPQMRLKAFSYEGQR